MAIRMQQRRGTAAQWTSANPVLGSGEIGYETDTGEFRVGDGVTTWANLSPFKNIVDLGGNLDDYIPLTFIGANDGVAALTSTGQVEGSQLVAFGESVTTLLSDLHTTISGENETGLEDLHLAVLSNISSSIEAQQVLTSADYIQKIATAKGEAATDATTKANAAKSDAETTASGYVSTHAAVTTNVHGISNTANLVTKAGTETLTNKTISAADNTVTVNLADVIDITATVSEVNKLAGLNTTKTELGYVNGVTSAIQTQIDTKAAKANPTFTGTVTAADISISGNLTVGGTTTTVNATNLEITDPLIYIATGNAANANDIGIVGHATVSGTYQHMGIVRDHADGKWKLFSGVTTEPTNVVAFSDSTAVYDTLKVGGIDFADGTQVKQGVPSLTTINQQSGGYTTVLSDRDKLVEINSASGVTLTIPTNASVAYPVGTSIDILQTGSGQVTIAGAGGVTVNSTPGLKLRTQWSSATLFKRATDTWVVFGDLSA